MKAFLVCGAVAVVATEAVGFVWSDHEALLQFSGVAVALTLLAGVRLLARGAEPEPDDATADDSGTALSRWVERTKSQIAWSATSRADWDRRLRPVLARQFEFATRQPRARDRKAFENAGRVHFGEELWAWVDPENISRTGSQGKGPGRQVLTDIIERLERL